jgi:protocatechuate 3,4-dioxygenase beta subunit
MKGRQFFAMAAFTTPVIAGIVLIAACAEQSSSPGEGGPASEIASQQPAQKAETSTTVDGRQQAGIAGCNPPAQLTPSMTEGPYYKAGAPESSSLLEQGMDGTRLVITGYVTDTDCAPVTNARLDFWQADAGGNYDNEGFSFRGYQFTDSAGRYQLATVIPGEYAGRTQHIHVKVQAPNGPVLTSQLFFPEAAGNATDRIFDERLLLNIDQEGESVAASFNFVIERR